MLLRLCNEFFYFLSIKHLEGLEERAIASHTPRIFEA